jgi:hypothetical protein
VFSGCAQQKVPIFQKSLQIKAFLGLQQIRTAFP